MAQSVFVDSWGWIALGHPRDSHHQEVSNRYRDLQDDGVGVCTSDYVLAEVITLLFRRKVFSEVVPYIEGLFASAEDGNITIEQITPARFARAWGLRRRFHDKPGISFTDLTSMALMTELGLTEVVTEDHHFTHVGLGFRVTP